MDESIVGHRRYGGAVQLATLMLLVIFVAPALAFVDTDGDGVPDSRETSEGTDLSDPHSYLDSDYDTVADYIELNTDFTLPNDASSVKDSDLDGVSDYIDHEPGATMALHSRHRRRINNGKCPDIRRK